MRTNFTLPTNSRGPSLNTRGFCSAGGMIMENFVYEIMESLLSEPFFTKRMKTLSGPDGFMLYDKLGVDIFSTSELLYPSMKIRLRLITATLSFNMISNNPNVS